jgi:uncharacterized membrane protein (DUF485 family)
VDQDIESRLARLERRSNFAVAYSSIALIWVIAQPEMSSFAQALGLSPHLGRLITAALAGGLGAAFAAFVMRKTSI